MQSHPSCTLYLPGEKERELWRRGADQMWTRTEGGDAAMGGVLAIEAMALESVPFWAVEPADGKLDVEKVASLKWESLGMEEDRDGKSWIHWTAGRSEKRVLIATAGLAPDSVSPDWIKVMPSAFEISPRLYPIPSGEAAVWRELGRLVVAFKHGDRLAHFSTLSARELNQEAAAEIRDLVWAMQVQGFVTKLSGVRIWTDAEPSFAGMLKEMLATPVWMEPKPVPNPSPEGSGLFPPEMARMRRQRAKNRQRTQLVMALAACYVMFFAAWAGWLYWNQQKITRQTAQLEAMRPRVDEVRRQQVRWQALEPATDPDSYPSELFQKIVSLLPAEGIRLKEFGLDLNKITISGEASTVGHAKNFQAAVTGSPGLKQYTWNFPQPTILDDNRANFNAEGILNSGGLPKP